MARGFKVLILTEPEDKRQFKQMKCPGCQADVGLWTDGIPKDHRCSNCDEVFHF